MPGYNSYLFPPAVAETFNTTAAAQVAESDTVEVFHPELCVTDLLRDGETLADGEEKCENVNST